MVEFINNGKAPQPNGHYSQATVAGGFVFVSTQLPINPESPDDRIPDVAEQTRQVLNNITNIFAAAGVSPGNIMRVTIYVTDIDDWATVNQAYTAFMGGNKPARGVVQVAGLHLGYKVAMDAVGYCGEGNLK